MADPVRETMAGALGYFWTDLNDVFKLDRASHGYVRLVDDELFHVGTLRTLEFVREIGRNQDRLPRPVAMYGMTESTRAIFFDMAGVSRSNVLGQQASTQTVRTRGVVVNVPFAVLENPDFKEVKVWIPEVTLWSGLQGASETVEFYDDERQKGYTASTVHVEPLEIQIRRGLKLTLGTTWSVEGPDDRRVLSTPLVFGTTSATPRTWQQHVVPLIAVQDLINLAYEGFVAAGHGTVQFQCKDDGQPRQTPQMWNSRLMAVSRGVSRPKSMFIHRVPLPHARRDRCDLLGGERVVPAVAAPGAVTGEVHPVNRVRRDRLVALRVDEHRPQCRPVVLERGRRHPPRYQRRQELLALRRGDRGNRLPAELWQRVYR
jgi:hypothetical protein